MFEDRRVEVLGVEGVDSFMLVPLAFACAYLRVAVSFAVIEPSALLGNKVSRIINWPGVWPNY